MPRGELKRHEVHVECTRLWHKNDAAQEEPPAVDKCLTLVEAHDRINVLSDVKEEKVCVARETAAAVVAVMDASALSLGPFGGALVPAAWCGSWPGIEPPEWVLATSAGHLNGSRIQVIPGMCKGNEPQIMLSVYNDSGDFAEIEHGMALAVARPVPPEYTRSERS